MPILIQEYLNNGVINLSKGLKINIKVITNNASIAPLMKDVIDLLLN